MKLLITGANGFIGKQIIQKLKNNNDYEIHATSRNKVISNSKNVYWHKIDLLNLFEIKKLILNIKPTHIIHLAWITEHKKYWDSLENLQWLKSSIELIESSIKVNCNKIVIAGTCAEYNWDYGLCTENLTPLASNNLYSSTKNSLSSLLRNISDKKLLSYNWARLFFVYGPYEKKERLIPYLINSFKNQETAICKSANLFRDFIHVYDVANIFINLIHSDFIGEVNIGTGESVRIEKIVLKIAELFKTKNYLIDKDENNSPILTANTKNLFKAINYEFKYNIEDGLKNTINWWLKN